MTHTISMCVMWVAGCACFFFAIRDYVLERVRVQPGQVVPTQSSWRFGAFEKHCLPKVAEWLRPYCRSGENALWFDQGALAWCFRGLMSMALDRNWHGLSLTWHGFQLAREEEEAVFAAALGAFHAEVLGSSLHLQCLRGVTVYAGNASDDMR